MIIDYFAKLIQSEDCFHNLKDIDTVTTCYHYLIATGHKKDKEIGADSLREAWSKERLNVSVPKLNLDLWQLINKPDIKLTILPPYSFSLIFTFRLAKPYISKDDNTFYIVDNPIVRDKASRLPMVQPSAWKGSLRHALWRLGARCDGEKYHDDRVKRMFGKTKSDDEGQAGRLFFYPTFFSKISLEIINPHDRVRRVGKNPILFESVPEGALGRFTLLYVPFDRVGNDETDPERKLKPLPEEIIEDLILLSEGLQAMFILYGFGAKTSSGFGSVEDKLPVEGKIAIRAKLPGKVAQSSTKSQSEPTLNLPRYLEASSRLIEDLRQPDGSIKTEEEYRASIEKRGQKYTKKDCQLYAKAKAWWEREGRTLAKAPTGESGFATEPLLLPTPEVAEWTFASLSELQDVAQNVATLLQEEMPHGHT